MSLPKKGWAEMSRWPRLSDPKRCAGIVTSKSVIRPLAALDMLCGYVTRFLRILA